LKFLSALRSTSKFANTEKRKRKKNIIVGEKNYLATNLSNVEEVQKVKEEN